MDSLQDLARNVKQRRVALALTQAELGKRAGVGGATIFRIEKAARGAVVGGSLDALASALGCEPWELILPAGAKVPQRSIDPAMVTVSIGTEQFVLAKSRNATS
jgi:transcriptional regulator with XRE-family HTH domain